MTSRPSTDRVLMDTAGLWAARSTCDRLHVGCVIALDGRVIATGYNGAPAGVEHCKHECDCGYPGKGGLFFEKKHLSNCAKDAPCKISVHAEANAICFAAKYGLSLLNATVYTTHAPCFYCSLLMKNVGIYAVIYEHSFRDMSGPEFLGQNGVGIGVFDRESHSDKMRG